MTNSLNVDVQYHSRTPSHQLPVVSISFSIVQEQKPLNIAPSEADKSSEISEVEDNAADEDLFNNLANK